MKFHYVNIDTGKTWCGKDYHEFDKEVEGIAWVRVQESELQCEPCTTNFDKWYANLKSPV